MNEPEALEDRTMKTLSRSEMRHLLDVELRFDAKSYPDPGIALPVLSAVIRRIEANLRDPIDLDDYLKPLRQTQQRLKEIPTEGAFVHDQLEALKQSAKEQPARTAKPGWFRSLLERMGGGVSEGDILAKVRQDLTAESIRLNDLVLQQSEDFSLAKHFSRELPSRLTAYRELRASFEAMQLLEEQAEALAAARHTAAAVHEKALGDLARKMEARARLLTRQESLAEDAEKQRRLCAEIVAGESLNGLESAQASLAAAETSLRLQIDAVALVDEQIKALESEVRRAEQAAADEDRKRDQHEVKLLELRSRRAAQVAADTFRSLILPSDALPREKTAGRFGLYQQALDILHEQLSVPGRAIGDSGSLAAPAHARHSRN